MPKNFISEDDIEQEIIKTLQGSNFDYNILICDASPEKKDDLNDGTGRSSKRQSVLPKILKESLYRINGNIPHEIIDEEAFKLSKDYTETDIVDTNYRLYKKIRESVKISIKRNNKEDFDFIKLIDYDNPNNNTFTAVSQMWIQGKYNYRRPDVLIFVNGLPLVFIELKNSIVKVEEAYNKNLKSYIKDVPNLFSFNQICVLSNGLETRLGAFNATYDYFFEWFKESENDKLDRQKISEEGLSISFFINGLLKKENLIDYIENFILFENQRVKLIAKNHQYLGVNNLMVSLQQKEALNGRLGVFWHTQGSGKSYSMVMFTRKVKRKINGNFTFLIITDRDDLDSQIHKNFVRTEVIGNQDETQPKDSEQLRKFLGQNKEFIFTLIHKFRYDKTKKYPILSNRNDIIVLVDEAHRTQYKDLAENMRTGLPNANYVAFTGTPLLGSRRLTNQWFGDYVSEYNFAQSVEDGSTVALFYSRRVPEVALQNNFLDDDIVDIIEDENLNDTETRLLENSSSRILEVIKRDDRLDKIAKDIAYHFPRRGFLGKGMVVSVDKYTVVKMYNKVQYYWQIEKQKLVIERNNAATKDDRERLTNIINYMNTVDMAVVISEEADEIEKFSKVGLDISAHRARMNQVDSDGKDIEDQFKDPYNNLQLVFICAMWLTGFDVPNLSTLYLDKPMKSHTLMQAIARANRVYPNKPCGIIVDYVNVFKFMRQALSDYAMGDEGKEMPVKDIEQLITNLDETITQIDEFLNTLGIDLEEIISESSTFDQLEYLRQALNKIVEHDDDKNKFRVLSNTMINLYEASKPEIFEINWINEKFSPINYINGLFYNLIDDQKVNRARNRMQKVLDTSVTSSEATDQNQYVIKGTKVIDLTKLDVSDVKKRLIEAPYKAIEVEDLREFIEKALIQMINKNQGRVKFSERYRSIIDRYNAGGTENEDYYEQLLQLIEDLKKEQERPSLLGLTEEELEIYDLLTKDKKLTQAEEQKVKLAAKNLLNKLLLDKSDLLVVDWYKDERTTSKVRTAILDSLDQDLPDSYEKDFFNIKTDYILSLFIDKAVQGMSIVS
ncbi:type I restriction endonuclease subunit R [Liberiplasma polymorphum]|uniref:type I restriction endonuclease subunit R n=1 Tax=Liberiplasma polymorphum TaxID=3374570 RepID=UPI00377341F1